MNGIVKDFIGYLANELSNTKGLQFGGHDFESYCLANNGLELVLSGGHHVVFVGHHFSRAHASIQRCPRCNQYKGGWPDQWQNDPLVETSRVAYVCKSCFEACTERDIDVDSQAGGPKRDSQVSPPDTES